MHEEQSHGGTAEVRVDRPWALIPLEEPWQKRLHGKQRDADGRCDGVWRLQDRLAA